MAKKIRKIKIVTTRGKNGEIKTELDYFDKELKKQISAVVEADIDNMDIVVAGLNKLLNDGEKLPDDEELKLYLLPNKPKAGL